MEKVKNSLEMTCQQVRNFDKYAIETLKIPGIVLMENAGLNCAGVIIEYLNNSGDSKACIVCGTGNNGGDGFVIARHLFNHGYETDVIIIGDMSKISSDAAVNLEIIKNLNINIINFIPNQNNLKEHLQTLKNCNLIVDALFGTGLSGRLKEKYIPLIEYINSLEKYIISIDIPSGLDCNTGEPLGSAVKANQTVTLAAIKKGFSSPDSKLYTGEVTVKPIGITTHVLKH